MKKLIIILTILLINTANSQVKYVLPCNQALLDESRSVLLSQIGVREKTGHNDGKEVVAYQESVDLNGGGYPWCQALQYWCFKQACIKLGMPPSAIPLFKTGSTILAFNEVMKKGKRVGLTVEVDDLIYWMQFSKKGGHVGRVVIVKSGGWVQTVEGNTSLTDNGDQREGQGCDLKWRNIYHPFSRMFLRGIQGFRNE